MVKKETVDEGPSIRWKQPIERLRRDMILEDLRKVLVAQREVKETIQKCKQQRQEAAHRMNVKEAHYLALVAKEYPSKETRAAAAEELLAKDETYIGYKQDLVEIDEKLFTAKLDLEDFEFETKILFLEGRLLANDGME